MIGGIHPEYNKLTADSKIVTAPAPKKVVLPLQQHIGAPCEPRVNVGDIVRSGQKIAEGKGFVSAPIHSSITGKVTAIGSARHPVLGEFNAITIEVVPGLELTEPEKKLRNPEDLNKDELKAIIKDAGIVGLGGAAFPTHVKLSPPPEKKIDTLIINGAECEPYLTCDHRIMIEEPEKILKGLKVIMKILEPINVYIGIEDNKDDALIVMQLKLKELGLGGKVKIAKMQTVYPQGSEKNLIQSITKREVPNAGGLPMDVGVVVQNVQTVKAIYDAVYEGKPLIERVVTITGAVKEPKNILVKIGTNAKELIDFCGGYDGAVGKVISGGPMMGIAQPDDNMPVIKGSSGVLVQLEDKTSVAERDCIRCGRCVDVCPVKLMPTMIYQYTRKEDYDGANDYFAMDCFECGSCSFICPSKIPLTHWVKVAKSELMKRKKK
ncbi:MAG TPA: electron transport complex subunit RsxC [Candidatus Nanoarchaeia archaeon]|nr:electron transport complex subunit RsxC [Candidatus Nanoarchaeia archaeon]